MSVQPASHRHLTRQPEKDELFFEELASGSSVTDACARAGYHRRIVYRWREEDEQFRERWHLARRAIVDLLEEEADRRGMHGYDEITQTGNATRVRRRYSDGLLLARLRALKPELYNVTPRVRLHGAQRAARPSHGYVLRDHIGDDILRRLVESGHLDPARLPAPLRTLVDEHLGNTAPTD